MSQATAPKRTRAEIARANGAKSRGPVTPEGKARSSQNARRHGLFSPQTLLPNESSADYRDLHDAHVAQFRPQTPIESQLVSAMTLARWRSLRLSLIETNLFTHELESLGPEVDASSPEIRLACAFERLASRTSLALLLRYQGLADRAYERAVKQLLSLRAANSLAMERTQQLERGAPQLPSPQEVAFFAAPLRTNPERAADMQDDGRFYVSASSQSIRQGVPDNI